MKKLLVALALFLLASLSTAYDTRVERGSTWVVLVDEVGWLSAWGRGFPDTGFTAPAAGDRFHRLDEKKTYTWDGDSWEIEDDWSVPTSSEGGSGAAWGAITGTLGDQTDLDTALDAKSDTGHAHAISDSTGLQTALDGKSATGHGHAIADSTGLQTALDGKSATGHAHAASDTTSGAFADARVDGSLEADELTLAGDVDGAANANDIDEAAVESELEGVIDLPDLQGVLTVAKGGSGAAPASGDQLLISDSTSAATWATVPDCDTANQSKLLYDQTTNAFSCGDQSPVVEANTAGSGAPNVLIATETNKVLTNEGASALNYHTLPSAAAGMSFTFVCQDADGIRVLAASGDTIRMSGSVSAAAGFVRSVAIGSVVTLVSINATEWIAVSIVGTWTIDG